MSMMTILNWFHEQIILHRKVGAEHADLRIIMTDRHHQELLAASGDDERGWIRLESYTERDPECLFRFKEVMGVEVITAAVDVDLPIPLVVRLAST